MTGHVDIDGVNFVPVSTAAKRVSYTPDYVARLAREGKVLSHKEGRLWFVELDSLKLFALEREAEKRLRQSELREERLHERFVKSREKFESARYTKLIAFPRYAIVKTIVTSTFLFLLIGAGLFHHSLGDPFFSVPAILTEVSVESQKASVFDSMSNWFGSLWLVRTREIRVVESVATEESVTSSQNQTQANSLQPFRQVPQIDAGNSDILIREQKNLSVEELFSDTAQVQFFDSRHGTITPVFRNSTGEDYTFRIIPRQTNENGNN